MTKELFYNKTILIRTCKEINDLIDSLIKDFPEKYQTRSQVIRSAVIQLRRLEDENKN